MPQTSHKSNFAFLADHDERLAKIGYEAEQLASISPTACMMQVRMLAELLAKETAAYVGIYVDEGASFFQVLSRLERDSAFHDDIKDLFHEVRMNANDVVHGEVYLGNAKGVATNYLRLTRKIAIWFHQSFGRDRDFSAGPFIDPPDLTSQRQQVLSENRNLQAAVDDAQKAVADANERAMREKHRRAEAEELLAQIREERNVFRSLAEEYEEHLAELRVQTEAAADEERVERQVRMREATDKFELDERETRGIIDAQLRQRGWRADTEELRWATGTRPEEGKCLAISEVPTAAGPADYVLFDGLTAVAVIEAKRWDQPVQGGIEQAKRYSRAWDLADYAPPAGSPWAIDGVEYEVPFAFASNGREYLHQLKTHRGIWFQDLRRDTNRSRPLAGWYTPDGLRRLIDKDVDDALAKLDDEPFDYLGLRYYQRQAVEAIERAIAHGRRKALLAMATGTGKTRTAIGLVYRLVKSGMFDRILFLVDRTSLGNQAFAAFQTTKLESHRAFTEIYDAKSLDDADIEVDTRLSIATVQSMVYRVFDGDEGKKPPIDDFDCIIVDECHRGYNLDREMSEVELEYRNQDDYISKYRRVLDYFDAMTIGLTATPALHTSDIFKEPVYTYRYGTAVIDGFLVDQDPPIRIKTDLGEHGLHFEEGQQLKLLDTATGELDFAHTPDELDFEIDSFNRAVITDGFNRAICSELADHIDPDAPGKTLVFCVSEAHAQMVVSELFAAYAEAGRPVTDNAIKVITGYTDDAEGWLRRYKNEKKPSIAITCDYLTTGIDVPEIVNLVFLRRVRSRILYEQMKGRATRLCDEINKTSFRIYDYVDLYDALEQVTDMKPVVQRPNLSIEQVYEELTTAEDLDHLQLAHQELIGKLSRRLKRLSDDGERRFDELAGMSSEEFLEKIRDREPEEAAAWLRDQGGVVRQIPELPIETSGVIYDDTPDEVVRIEEVEVDEADYLEEFEQYVRAHLDSMEALQIVTRRPRELTRRALLE
ncbi:MAG: type I restriction-modification system endonuclease, partial [Persicimonas sp.]